MAIGDNSSYFPRYISIQQVDLDYTNSLNENEEGVGEKKKFTTK